jgi:choline monooxygenase
LPASWYHGTDRYEAERRSIFSTSWLLLGHVADLERPGDRLGITMAGFPLLIVRDESGEIHGFHNVCPHRAGPLAEEGTSGGPSIVCRYHGWSFDLHGTLLAARDFGEPGPEERACGLRPITVAVWRNLIFGCLDGAQVPLIDDLGGFAAAAAGQEIEAFRPAGEYSHELRCNWKTYAENYLEGYHLPLVHPGLTREVRPSQYRIEVGDRWCRHEVPTRKGAVNAGRWLWRWPNLALNLYPDSMNIEQFVPTGPSTTTVTYRYFTRDGELDDSVVAMSRTVLEEDAVICEAVQKNLDAGVYVDGVLSPKYEMAVAAFQRLVATRVGER